MPAQYEKQELRFQYPDNWTLADEQWDEWPHVVSVQSPSGAFWTVHSFPPGSDPQSLTQEVLQTLRQEYGDVDSDVVVEDLLGNQAVGYGLDFYCLDFVVSAQALAVTIGNSTLLFVYQAEMREFSDLLPVFRAMMFSVAQSLT